MKKRLSLISLFTLLLFSDARNQSTLFHTIVHEFYHFLGTDISFTPITYDMAGAWNSGKDFYAKDLYIKATHSKTEKLWPINTLNLYTVKLPFLLCFELYPNNQLKNSQCAQSLCSIGQKLSNKNIKTIELVTKNAVKSSITKSLLKVSCNE